MFRFESPEYLYLLIAIPFLIALFWLNRVMARKRLKKLGKPEHVKKLMPSVSAARVWVKFSLLMGAMAMIILMLARPQMGMKMKTDTANGIEVVMAVDVSNSMNAQDVEPSRLDKAKYVLSSLSKRLSNNKMALVAFAGNAFLQMPLSADKVSVDMFLDQLTTNSIPTQGTSIAEALTVCEKSFSNQEEVSKAVVLITDGEDHEGGVETVLADLKEQGVKVYVLGIGDTKGSPIAMKGDYLRDMDGNVVITRLNEDMCKSIATEANGTYIHIDNSNSAQEQLINELNQLQKSKLDTAVYEDYNDLFPWLAIVVLILLVIEVVLLPNKSHYFDNWHLFSASQKVKTIIIIALAGSMSLGAMAQSQTKVETHKGVRCFNKTLETPSIIQNWKKANAAYIKDLNSRAVVHYKKAIALDSTNYKAHYNLGNTYISQGKGDLAVSEFQQAAKYTQSSLAKGAIYHNIGTVYQANKKYDEAIDAYKESLRAYPQDDRTRYNLAECQRYRKKNPNQNQDNQDNQDNKDKQQQQQQKQNQDQKQNPQKDNKQQQQQPPKMDKQNAEQMLRAAQMKERETKEKMNSQPASRRSRAKNW